MALVELWDGERKYHIVGWEGGVGGRGCMVRFDLYM